MMSPTIEDARSGSALHAAKRQLRLEVAVARDALDPAAREAGSRAIAERISGLESFLQARTLLVTLPYRSEWDTTRLARLAIEQGKTVVAPRVDAAARVLHLHSIADLRTDVAPGWRGIPEPRHHRPRVEPDAIDWILVPGLAFDRSGRRLGYGGGYYDRLLPLIAAAAARVAGAYDLQLVAHVPSAPHDLFVDWIVTPSETVTIPNRAS